MSKEYREYTSRRATHKSTNKKGFGYFKKLIRQAIVSAIIFSVVITPELMGIEMGKYIKNLTKSALLYTVDTNGINKFFKDIYLDSIHKGDEKNEKTETTSKNI